MEKSLHKSGPRRKPDNIGTGTVTTKTRNDGSSGINEYTDTDQVVGRYYADNEYWDTKWVIIFCSKKGIHVVPTVPKED